MAEHFTAWLLCIRKYFLPVFKYLFYSTVLLVLKLSWRKRQNCMEILRWISRMAVLLEGNSIHAKNNFVWTITGLIPGLVHRDFKPMICRSLCFFLQLSNTSHKFASISTVSGLHFTIYSPLHFLFFFWHFQYKCLASHFKLLFQTKFNFKIVWKQKTVFYSSQCSFVRSLFQQKNLKPKLLLFLQFFPILTNAKECY